MWRQKTLERLSVLNLARSTMEKVFFLLMFCHVFCDGFDFILHQTDVPETSNGRQECGVLRCSEILQDASTPTTNTSRRLTSITVYKNRLNGGSKYEDWQQLASLTQDKPALKRVSDGISVSGQLSEQNAEISLKLFKPNDCHEAQFSCAVVYVDNLGKTSLTKSVVGEGIRSEQYIDLQHNAIKKSILLGDRRSDDQLYPAATLVLSLLQSKFDAVAMRLDDSLKALENRLEDKIVNMQAALDNRIFNLENRLEDKLMNLHIRVSEEFGLIKASSSCVVNESDQVTSQIDQMKQHVEDTVAASVNKMINDSCKDNDKFTSQLATVLSSVKSLEKNLSAYNEDVNKLETALDHRNFTAAKEGIKLAGLISGVSSLSGLTQNLLTKVDTLSNSYAGGALVPVDTLSDPLGVGKKEWRLVFRGTAYNNIEMYPAYMLGTGIPVEVEEGCKQFNRSLPCVNHYRDRQAFDNWVGIDEVLLAIYKVDKLVQRVVFNGRGSTYTSWFTAGRVDLSSWEDLTTQPHNFFSIEGYVPTDPGHIRRFHINRDYDNGCGGFKGWLSVKDSAEKGCPAEPIISMPMIMYATGKTFSPWNGADVARADALGIFVKYE